MRHHLTLSIDGFKPELKFLCTEPESALCHRRPLEEGVEEWGAETPLDEGGNECWAVQFIEEAGMEDGLVVKPDGILLSVPVNVFYDDGVVAEVVTDLSPTGTPSDDAVQAGAYAFDPFAGNAPEDYPGDWETAMGESRRILTAAYPAMEKEIRAKIAKELM